MTRVEILGPDGPQGAAMRAAVDSAIAASGRPACVLEVRDMDLITSYRVMTLPSLVVNERVCCAGRIPSVAEITAWLCAPAG